MAENSAGKVFSDILFSNIVGKLLEPKIVYAFPKDNERIQQYIANCINCYLKNIPTIEVHLEDNISTMFSDNSSIYAIDLSFNEFQTLPDNIFITSIKGNHQSAASSEVYKLTLKHCHISHIDDGAFNGLNSLEFLDISDNKLITVPTPSFIPLKKLQFLNLSVSNQFKNISSAAFVSTKTIRILNLSFYAISEIENTTFLPLQDSIEELYLNYNRLRTIHFLKLESVPSILQNQSSPTKATTNSTGWKRLQVLDISSNFISHIAQKSFPNMNNLRRLNLSSCLIGAIEFNAFAGLIHLETLDLSSNLIYRIDNRAFASLTSIMKELRLDDNILTIIPYQFFNVQSSPAFSTETIKINVTENPLQCVCHNTFLFHWIKTHSVNVASSMVTDCASQFSQMKCPLDALCLVNSKTNNLEIPWYFADSKGVCIDCGVVNNDASSDTSIELVQGVVISKLDTIDFTVYTNSESNPNKNGSSLRELTLGRCRIAEMANNIFNSTNMLNLLDLSGNELNVVPTSSLGPLKHLFTLNLSSNPIDKLSSDAFTAVDRLKTLNLSHCAISVIEKDAFRRLQRLEILDLSWNKLAVIGEQVFLTLYNINKLLLNDNLLTRVSTSVFNGVIKDDAPTNITINLKNNVLDCDCSNYDIMEMAGSLSNMILINGIEQCKYCVSKNKCLPYIYDEERNYDPNTVECKVQMKTGNAEIKWSWGNRLDWKPNLGLFVTSTFTDIKDSGTFKKSKIVFTDVGFSCQDCDFKCEAQNKAGKDVKIKLFKDGPNSRKPIAVHVAPIKVNSI